MNSPLDSESLQRITDALEALAAAQTHELWANHLKTLVKSRRRPRERPGSRLAHRDHRSETFTPMSFWSSPDTLISRTMSQPPMNCPPTYSWGIVGHWENSLIP